MLFIILIIISLAFSVLIGVCEGYGFGIEEFCKGFFLTLIFTTLISFMLSLVIGSIICEDAAVKPIELKETFELQENGLIKNWSSDGYEYIYITKDYKIKQINSNLVEIKTLEKDIKPYCEKWSYDYSSDGLRFWFWNINANKYIFYVPEDWAEGND